MLRLHAAPLLVFVMSFASMLGARAVHAQGTEGQRALPCAVEGSARPLRAAELCSALQRELGRPMQPVDDARTVQKGDALQLIHDDVQWSVIWMIDGRIRVWTRVSKADVAEDQVRFLARATRALAKAARTKEPNCLRLDPNAGHKMRSPDLTYPWAALAPCKRKYVEVVDPWWFPEASDRAG